jgi:hypothetical protein
MIAYLRHGIKLIIFMHPEINKIRLLFASQNLIDDCIAPLLMMLIK